MVLEDLAQTLPTSAKERRPFVALTRRRKAAGKTLAAIMAMKLRKI